VFYPCPLPDLKIAGEKIIRQLFAIIDAKILRLWQCRFSSFKERDKNFE
jgi:hypothetical protein